MLKVNNKDTRTAPVNFQHVIAGWVDASWGYNTKLFSIISPWIH